MEPSEAIQLAKEFAENYNPPYFTTIEDFQPHPWIVAAIIAAHGKGYDKGYDDAYCDS
jgi:hypothetical protein